MREILDPESALVLVSHNHDLLRNSEMITYNGDITIQGSSKWTITIQKSTFLRNKGSQQV